MKEKLRKILVSYKRKLDTINSDEELKKLILELEEQITTVKDRL